MCGWFLHIKVKCWAQYNLVCEEMWKCFSFTSNHFPLRVTGELQSVPAPRTVPIVTKHSRWRSTGTVDRVLSTPGPDGTNDRLLVRQVYKPLLYCAAQCRTPFDSCAFLLQKKLNWTQTLCCGGGAQASVKTCCLHLLIIFHFLLSSSPCLSSSSSLLLITFNPVSQWCQNYHLGSSLGLSMCRSNPAP